MNTTVLANNLNLLRRISFKANPETVEQKSEEKEQKPEENTNKPHPTLNATLLTGAEALGAGTIGAKFVKGAPEAMVAIEKNAEVIFKGLASKLPKNSATLTKVSEPILEVLQKMLIRTGKAGFWIGVVAVTGASLIKAFNVLNPKK